MERRGVLVIDNKVVNVVVWGDSSEDQFLNDGFQHAEEITNLVVQPRLGWTWSKKDGYRSPQPFPSWTYNGVDWEAPVAHPEDGGNYSWNEETQTWTPVEA